MADVHDKTRRIIRANGRVVPLTKPMGISAFADAIKAESFGLVYLPHLGDKPRYVAIFDGMARDKALPVNQHATQIYRATPANIGTLRGDVAILPDGDFGAFYP